MPSRQLTALNRPRENVFDCYAEANVVPAKDKTDPAFAGRRDFRVGAVREPPLPAGFAGMA